MLIFDVEADGFLAGLTKIHCINTYDTATKTARRFNDTGTWAKDGTLADGLALLVAAEQIAGHNAHDYDVPALQKIYPGFQPTATVHDTRAYCRLIWPEIKDRDFAALRKGALPLEFQKQGLIGLHSLKAWGYRLGEHKGEFPGPWDTFTQVMDDYCMQDVRVTAKLVAFIEGKQHDPRALQIENDTQRIISRQERYGFGFDQAAAEKLLVVLQRRRLELETELRQAFRPWYRPVYTGGNSTFLPKRDNKTAGYTAGVPLTKIEYTDFNPGSRDHIADRLIRLYGWKPTEFTPEGKPKVDETVLEGLKFPEAVLLQEYLTVDKRLGQIAEGREAWTKAVQPDGRIHGKVNTGGAVTGRMTHSRPNIAQVPAAKSPYGLECRALFIAPPGKRLVGCDAKGLELRCLAHYLAAYDGGAYAKVAMEGDIHALTQQAAGIPTREQAKTFIYAWLYGAGAAKLGAIVGKGAKAGEALRKRMLKNIPELNALLNGVQAVVKKRGYLIGLDGRKLVIRSQHTALNTLLQSAGAVVMKKALILLDAGLQAEGLRPGEDYEFAANIHDELQIEAKEYIAEHIGQAAAASITQAGDYFGFRCRLEGEYKVGRTWADTH